MEHIPSLQTMYTVWYKKLTLSCHFQFKTLPGINGVKLIIEDSVWN